MVDLLGDTRVKKTDHFVKFDGIDKRKRRQDNEKDNRPSTQKLDCKF